MKTILDLPSTFIEPLCYHRALTALGFKMDDIWVAADEPERVLVILRTQGKEFVIVTGDRGGLTGEEWRSAWHDCVQAWNSAGRAKAPEIQIAYNRSQAKKRASELVIALVKKNFLIPIATN